MAGLNLFTNNASTTLASGINSSVTSLTVAAGTGGLFPSLAGSQYFYCTLTNVGGSVIEIVKVTARSTDTFTIVRAQDNTTAASFSAGDKVELRLTAIDLQNFPQLDSTNTFSQAQTFTSGVVLTVDLPVTDGGTGASDATTARSNLSAAKSGANSDITSLTGLTTALSVAQGGTGATTLTANNVVLGNGTSAPNFVAPGSAGNVLTSNGTTWTSAAAAAFDAGTRLAFQQTAAPTGWTKDTTAAINDSMLRLVTGAASSGGTTAFSTWNAVTATGAYTLATADIPSHTHSYTYASNTSDGGGKFQSNRWSGTTGATTGGTGGGGSHSHSLTRSLKYYDFIIASKN